MYQLPLRCIQHSSTWEWTLNGETRSESQSSALTRGFIANVMHSTARETMLDSAIMHFAAGRVDQPALLSLVQSVGKRDTDHVDGRGLPDFLYWYKQTRNFNQVHQALLNLDGSHDPLKSRLDAAITQCDIDKVDRSGRSSLAWAVEYRYVGGVQALLNFGASASFVRRSVCGDQMPLLHLLLAGPTDDITALLGIVEALLRAGADIMATDSEGWTALHIAASWNMYTVSWMLLEFQHGRELRTAQTDRGETAYDLACASECDEGLRSLLNFV